MNLFDAMASKGIPYPPNFDPLKMGFHRYGKNSRYWLRMHCGMASFGDHVTNESHTWFAEKNTTISREQIAEQFQQSVQLKKEKEYSCSKIASQCERDWNALPDAGSSPYLFRKQVSPFGLRYYYDSLVIPIRDIDGKLWSLQYIHANGFKRYIGGGKKRACFHTIGKIGNSVIVGEGYATLASIHMATGATCIVAFDAGNIAPVIEALERKYPHLIITIAVDDDRWKPEIGNIGRTKANAVAKHHGCITALPRFKDITSKPTDWNDLHVLEGLKTVRTQLMEVLPC